MTKLWRRLISSGNRVAVVEAANLLVRLEGKATKKEAKILVSRSKIYIEGN